MGNGLAHKVREGEWAQILIQINLIIGTFDRNNQGAIAAESVECVFAYIGQGLHIAHQHMAIQIEGNGANRLQGALIA